MYEALTVVKIIEKESIIVIARDYGKETQRYFLTIMESQFYKMKIVLYTEAGDGCITL